MHIIIPMSGSGSRFVNAGYKELKPLIVIDGKTIIEHVCDMFPSEDKITFICRDVHLETTEMRAILNKVRPNAQIIATPTHKLGPVHAVSFAFDHIDDDEEVIINYCDFGVYWDYADFLKHTRARNAEGAIPAYKGFHPHMLGSTNYAFMRDEQQWMQAIQEKKPFTDNRLNEYASSGTYYFKRGAYVKKYFPALIEQGLDLNGEYYVSMVYNLLQQDRLRISIYEIQHMLQWGTPEDVAEYRAWSQYFRELSARHSHAFTLTKPHVNVIPMAGLGSRFSKVGYTTPKPLIPVSGKPMVIQAVAACPQSPAPRFVCLEQHLKQYPLQAEIEKYYPAAKIIPLPAVTEGQAITCLAGLDSVPDDVGVFIAACDNSMLVDTNAFQALADDETVDAIVLTFKHHPSVKRNPHMYGFVEVNAREEVTGVSVKVPLSNSPDQDHAIVGAFYFKSAALFRKAVAALQTKNQRVNGEFYVDSIIGVLAEMGKRVKPFVVDHYICWGTPDDLKTFEYWQSFFHKAKWHPYRIETDPDTNPVAMPALSDTLYQFAQEYA